MLTFHLFLYFVRVRLCPFAISVLRSIRDPKEENYFFNGIGRAEIVNDLDLIKVSIQCRQGKSRAQQLRVASKIVRFSLEASPCGTEEILHNKLILCAPNNAPDAVKMVVLPFDAHLKQKKNATEFAFSKVFTTTKSSETLNLFFIALESSSNYGWHTQPPKNSFRNTNHRGICTGTGNMASYLVLCRQFT